MTLAEIIATLKSAQGVREQFRKALALLVQAEGSMKAVAYLAITTEILEGADRGLESVIMRLEELEGLDAVERVLVDRAFSEVSTPRENSQGSQELSNEELRAAVEKLLERGVTDNEIIAKELGISAARVNGFKSHLTILRNRAQAGLSNSTNGVSAPP